MVATARARPPQGGEAVRSRRARVAGEVAKELLLIAAAGVTYAGVRELTEGNYQTAVDNGRAVHELEQKLGLAWESAAQSAVLPHSLLVDLANWVYIWGHWPVIAACALVLFTFRRDHYRLLRNAVLISGGIGFAFFTLLPTAPPRLADPAFVDTVTAWSTSYRTLQPPAYTNQVAAMPSLHFGWNLLVGVTLFLVTRSLILRAFAVAMPAAMAFAVVATANHWVLDVVAGSVVVLVALVLVLRSARKPAGREVPVTARSGSPRRAGAPRGSARSRSRPRAARRRSEPRARPRARR